MAMSSTLFKKRIFVASFLIFGLSLTACSRGKNTPTDWNKDSMLKVKCKSPKAFDLEKEIEALIKSNIEDESAANLYVVRTIPVKHTSTSDEDRGKLEYHQAPFSGGFPSEVALTEYYNSTMFMSISGLTVAETNKLSCSDLSRSYEGPGVESGFVGKLKAITNKSITISAKYDNGDVTTVTIEKVAADPKTQKKEAGKDRLRKELGIGYFNITVEKKTGDISRTIEYQQRVTLKKDEYLDVDASVIADARALVENVSPAAAMAAETGKVPKLNLAGIVAKHEAQKAKKSDEKWKFSELMALKSAFPLDVQMTSVKRIKKALAVDNSNSGTEIATLERVEITGSKSQGVNATAPAAATSAQAPAAAPTQVTLPAAAAALAAAAQAANSNQSQASAATAAAPNSQAATAADPNPQVESGTGTAQDPYVLKRVEITGKREAPASAGAGAAAVTGAEASSEHIEGDVTQQPDWHY